MKRFLHFLNRKNNVGINEDAVTASNSFFSQLRHKLQALHQQNPQRLVVVALLSWMVIIGLAITYVLSNHQQQLSVQWSDNEQQQTAKMVSELHQMGEQLQTLAVPRHSAEFQAGLQALTQQMVGIQKNISTTAKATDMDRLFAQLDGIKIYIDEIEKMLGEQLNTKKYLDLKNLPFEVIAIDVIAQLPFVSVDYQHSITPMSMGDSLAGWKVIQADYATQTVEFQNQKNQYVKVSIHNSVEQ